MTYCVPEYTARCELNIDRVSGFKMSNVPRVYLASRCDLPGTFDGGLLTGPLAHWHEIRWFDVELRDRFGLPVACPFQITGI